MNPTVLAVPPSAIRAINARKRPGDLDLGLGEPVLSPDPASFEAALEWTRANGSPYSPTLGFTDLREALAVYLSEGLDAPLTAGNVCVTVGSEEALYVAIRALVDPAREEVLIVEPCFPAYPKICRLEGIPHRTISLRPEEAFRPRADLVLDALRPETRLIVINTPSNPTGRVWPREELEALAAGLSDREKPPVYVLADEVYRELYYGEGSTPSLASVYPPTVRVGSLSKSNALTGLRLGWITGPREVVDAAAIVHQLINTAATTFSQRVAVALLADLANLRAHLPHYQERRAALVAAAERYQIEIIPPEGAFYALVRLPSPWQDDSARAAEALLTQERVMAIPGSVFGGCTEGWLRVSWVAGPEVIEEGLRRISSWLKGG